MKPNPLFLHRPPTRNTLLHDGPPPAWDRLKARTLEPAKKAPVAVPKERKAELTAALEPTAIPALPEA